MASAAGGADSFRAVGGVRVAARRVETKKRAEETLDAGSGSLSALEAAVARVTSIREEIQQLVEGGHGTKAEAKLQELKRAVESVTDMQKRIESSIRAGSDAATRKGFGRRRENNDDELKRLTKENETLISEMAEIAKAGDAKSFHRRSIECVLSFD